MTNTEHLNFLINTHNQPCNKNHYNPSDLFIFLLKKIWSLKFLISVQYNMSHSLDLETCIDTKTKAVKKKRHINEDIVHNTEEEGCLQNI